MNDSKYRYTLYIIIIVIIATIGIQAYWNYKNYLSSKQQLINDVQLSLDKAVDDYYTSLARKTTLGLKFDGDSQKNVFKEGGFIERLSKSIDSSESKFKNLENIEAKSIEGISVFRGLEVDSMVQKDKTNKPSLTPKEFKDYIRDLKANDSIDANTSGIEMLTSKIVISIKNDSLDITQIDSLLLVDLNRKKIHLKYKLNYKDSNKDSISVNTVDAFKSKDHLFLSTTSKSTFLPLESTLSIEYQNETWLVLQQIFWGILTSTLLILAVISCLFYLLKVIKHQKQLAEVKNDLISNITHEFKTPISTISVALESIKSFNAINDTERTKSYLDISENQLTKLNTMVEKLLETATLDSDNLKLDKEETNITNLVKTLINKHLFNTNDKAIHLETSSEDINFKVDVFHFENAINNIIDNAIKYGGEKISVSMKQTNSSLNIDISDNGSGLAKIHKERVFEKFYRVPKGNTHDVKGFGIGLYYTKKIIEKHHGNIFVETSNNLTTFKITLPND